MAFNRVLVLAGGEHAVAHAARVVGQVDADVVGLSAQRAVILMVGIQDHVGLLHRDRLGHRVLVILLPVVGGELVLVLQERVLVALRGQLVHGGVRDPAVTA